MSFFPEELVLVLVWRVEIAGWDGLGVFLISPRKIFYSASGVSSLIVRLGGTLDRFGPYHGRQCSSRRYI